MYLWFNSTQRQEPEVLVVVPLILSGESSATESKECDTYNYYAPINIIPLPNNSGGKVQVEIWLFQNSNS